MARFKGKVATRPDITLPVIIGALLIIAVVLLAWFFIDRAGFMIWWDSLAAAVRR